MDVLTVSSLATRWQISRHRVATMLRSGLIPGAFEIPAAGRYGSAIRIPLSHVRALEESWFVSPTSDHEMGIAREYPVPHRISHFPELYDLPESDAECPSSDRRSGEHTA